MNKSDAIVTRAKAEEALQRSAGNASSGGETVYTGQFTLTAGLVTVSGLPGITIDSIVTASLFSPHASTALGILKFTNVPGSGFEVDSISVTAPPATQTGDASTYDYIVTNPI